MFVARVKGETREVRFWERVWIVRRPFEEWTLFLSTLFIGETVGRCRDLWMKRSLIYRREFVLQVLPMFFLFLYEDYFKRLFSKVISKVET